MRLAFLSIPKVLPKEMTATDAFRTSGNNLGNMVFVNAISDQLVHADSMFSYKLDADLINNEFDAVVIPAANWLNSGIDLGGFYEAIKKIRKPCVMIGIGAQSDSYSNIPKIPAGTRRFLDFVSERSSSIGTRGNFSEEVLHHYGYESGIAVGCPSLYWSCSKVPPNVSNCPLDKIKKVVMQGTRHNIPNDSFYKSGSAADQRTIIMRARAENIPYIIQSEFEELLYINGDFRGDSNKIKEKLELYYDEKLNEGLGHYLGQNMHFFYDISDWAAFLKNYDFLLTSRIHGCIMALHAGIPALLICHDTRTLEIAEYAGLPYIDYNTYLRNSEINYLYSCADYSVFYKKYENNFAKYSQFLNTNNLVHVLN